MEVVMESNSFRWLLVGAIAATIIPNAPILATPAAPVSSAARDLWEPGGSRFIRHWTLSGLMNGRLPDDDLRNVFSGGHETPGAWNSQDSWTDVVDLAGMTGAQVYRGQSAPSQTAYAYADMPRPAGGDEVQSFASDGPVRVWLNGKLVHDMRTARTLAFDQDRIPLHFVNGPNRLLLEFQHRSGPWRFAARLLRAGQSVTR